MDPEIAAAWIGAGVALVAAMVTFVDGRRRIRAQAAESAGALKSARETLERQLDEQRRALQAEQRHELTAQVAASRNEFDVELLKRRLDAYQQLFALLEPLSLDGRPPPDEAQAQELVTAITRWYTTTGGVLLGPRSRDALFRLRRELRGVPVDERDDTSLKAAYPPRRAASKLRSRLVEEVLTRRQALDPPEPPPPS